LGINHRAGIDRRQGGDCEKNTPGCEEPLRQPRAFWHAKCEWLFFQANGGLRSSTPLPAKLRCAAIRAANVLQVRCARAASVNLAAADFFASTRSSPIRRVTPVRSKYSMKGMITRRVVPIFCRS